jgi:cytochrome c-type biogenesis protein CcmH
MTSSRKVTSLGILLVSLLAALAVGTEAAPRPTLESISSQVMCICGCNAPLAKCPHIDCSTRAEMEAYIRKELAGGKDETAILQGLTLRYGVQVLAAPPARGFNLTVWILPSVGLLLGFAGVVVIARRWRCQPAIVVTPVSAAADPQVLAAVEDEMKATGLGGRA